MKEALVRRTKTGFRVVLEEVSGESIHGQSSKELDRFYVRPNRLSRDENDLLLGRAIWKALS